MSVQPRSDVELIEHLDWEHTPQCEHRQHGTMKRDHDNGPAYVLVQAACECGRSRRLYICQRFWSIIVAGVDSTCPACHRTRSAHSVFTPLGWVE